jgi:hypothetical protein
MSTGDIEKFVLEDGRKAEKTVVEKVINKDEVERVIEVKAEEIFPLKTQQRIVEKIKSFVCERRIETIDQKTGNVIDVKVETFSSPDQVSGVETSIQSHVKEEKKLNSLGAINEVVENETNKKSFNMKDVVLTVVIVAQVLGLAYLLFFN